MTESIPRPRREWISATRPSVGPEDPPPADERVTNGGPRGRPAGEARQLSPSHILGCNHEEALDLFHGRPVTPGEAEAIAQRSYHWRRHLHDSDSYWITTAEAARILALTPRQVTRLLDGGQLPHVRHVSRVRLMRRADIVAVTETR